MSAAPQKSQTSQTTSQANMACNPLQRRDLNIEEARKSQLRGSQEACDPPTKPANHHLNLLGKKRSQGQERPYISPSDAIQTPTTQKLQDFKHKLISKGPSRGPLFKSAPRSASDQLSLDNSSLKENAKPARATSPGNGPSVNVATSRIN